MSVFSKLINALRRIIGLESNKTGHVEKWVSGLGGLCGIFAVVLISRHFVPEQGAAWVVASMGATAVLLFAVPHGPLSQPWPVFAGHVISAVIGVICARWVPDALFAAALAVAGAIAAMHYLQCIHPPGGATALTAVLGGEQLHALGFNYVLTPVLLNVLVILVIAIAFNFPFAWRRYPAVLAVHPSIEGVQNESRDSMDKADLQKALQAMNSTIDISGQDLLDIYRLARQIKASSGLRPKQLQAGHYYSNGEYGGDWQVRQIIDMVDPMLSADDLLIYKVVAGIDRRKTNTVSFTEFAAWARYEVFLNESSWQRKMTPDARV